MATTIWQRDTGIGYGSSIMKAAAQEVGMEDFDTTVTFCFEKVKYTASNQIDGCGLLPEVDSAWYLTSSRKNEFINFSEEDNGRIEVVARYIIVGEERTVWGCTTIRIKIIDVNRK